MSNVRVGEIVDGEITGITKYGIFVRLEDNYNGLIHISEISDGFISDISTLYSIGNIIRVKILEVDEDKLHVKLSMKKIVNRDVKKKKGIIEKGTGFEPLKDNLNTWIDNKLKEIEKNENN